MPGLQEWWWSLRVKAVLVWRMLEDVPVLGTIMEYLAPSLCFLLGLILPLLVTYLVFIGPYGDGDGDHGQGVGRLLYPFLIGSGISVVGIITLAAVVAYQWPRD
jgi:hypothetical protein